MRIRDSRVFLILILGFWKLVQQTCSFYLCICGIAMDVKPIRLARNKNERGRHVNNIVCSYVAPRITSKTPAIKFQITSTTQKCSLGSNQSHRNSRERSLDSNQKDESDSTNLKCSSSPTSAGGSSRNGITQKDIWERVC